MSKSKTITPVTSTELVTISSEETAKVAIGDVLIKQMEAACDKCEAIEIVDEASLQVGRQQLKVLNQTIKAIDEQRKIIKAPYWDACKKIDAVANMLVERAQAVVDAGKRKISDYEIEAKKRADELVIQAEMEAEAKLKENQAKINAANQMTQKIADYEKDALDAFSAASNIDELKAAHEQYIKPGFPGPEEWGDQQTAAKAMFKRIVDFKDNRKKALLQQKELAEQGQELSALEKKKLALKAEMEKLEAEEKAEQERLAAEAAAAEQKRKDDELAKMREQAVIQTSSPNVGTMRETISWELNNWDKVPEEWKQLNEDAIKIFIKEHKGSIVNGSIVNGVRFLIDRKPVL